MRTALICFLLFLLSPCWSVSGADSSNANTEGRPAKNNGELQYWLANMAVHQFTPEDVGLALGVSTAQALTLIEKSRHTLPSDQKSIFKPGMGNVVILPYPGGRHPRIGFLEGAIRPQRETKVSVFAPWAEGGYIVVDFPEAVWHQTSDKRELLYLAHTHVPTLWDKTNVQLPTLEWNRDEQNALSLTRELPNKVKLTSLAKVIDGGVRFQFSITNGTSEKLTGLHIQMCGMLKRLTGFDEQTNDNKVFASPFAACKSRMGNRWVILGFDHCIRAWGNARCPCLHADPQVPDCAPGETQMVHGWLSFFEGEEIAGELKQLETIAFEPVGNP
jgi:hypothetical protein